MTQTPPWMTGGAPVNNHDTSSMVPHYDIHGCQHHRNPYKDKSHLQDVEIRHHRWLQPAPPIKSRAELQQARKRGQIPEVASYDFDGDGVVSQLDYFVGRSFDRDCDGRLTPGERKQAEKALDNGFLQKFVRGLDSQGDKMRPFAIQQKRGVILSADNAADVSCLTYPKHHNAHHSPKHTTKTALELNRWGERKGAGAAVGERYIAANCPVPEPVPPNHATHPRTCEIDHIRQRAEADHQLARVKGGLMPMNSYVNPERECRDIGLGYDAAPPMVTRSQLLETRKEGMRRECEELRTKCDGIQVPLSVRRCEGSANEYEFRRGGDHNMTLTKLKDRRRRDKIEYDMGNFEHKAKTYPKFSDRADIPFWADGSPEPGNVYATSAPLHAMPRTLSEPVFKITEQPFGEDLRIDPPDAANHTAAGMPAKVDLRKTGKDQNKQAIGSQTKKRFTTEMLERGQARNMPRLFDAIQPLHAGPRDMESLDVTSSMAPIRDAALKKNAEERKRNQDNPRRSMLWSESSGQQQSASAPSLAERGINDSAMMGNSMDGMGSMDVSRRSQERSSSLGGPPMRAPATRVHHVATDPGGRTGEPRIEAPREPRIFGAVARSQSEIGVRCGGFQRLDWPAQHPRAAPSATTGAKGRSDHGRTGSQNMARRDMGHSTSQGSMQPL